jgi:hypothetical protein
MFGRADRSAGAKPHIVAVNRATIPVKSRTRASSGTWVGIGTDAGGCSQLKPASAHRPSTKPAMEAVTARSPASTASWRVTARRLAPSATRRAISRSRSTARASSSWLTLTHAISSTTPTDASNRKSAVLDVPIIASCAGSAPSVRPD